MADTYQVLRVKPGNLESALNETSRQGWEVHSIIPGQASGSGFGVFLFLILGRGTVEVSEYHLVLRRP